MSIDWFELAGCIEWSPDSAEWFQKLNQARELAQQSRGSAVVRIGEHSVAIESRGIGSKKDSHKEILMKWQGTVVIAVSERKDGSRKLSNFLLRVPGEACLIVGAEAAVKAAWQIVATLGGKVTDEWLRRIDFCIDIIDFDLRTELLPAYEADQFIGTLRNSSCHKFESLDSGLTVGKLPHVRINVYDKKLDTLRHHNDLYRQAMIDRRWGGSLPKCATRVEWQCGSQWLGQYTCRSGLAALAEPGAWVERLVSVGPDPRCLFRLTEEKPDRENGNQSRAGVLPAWQWIIERILEWSGPAQQPLQRIQRGVISFERAYKVVVGTLTTVANVRRECVRNIHDVIQVLRELFTLNGKNNDWIADSWVKKAKRSGTYDEIRKPKDAA